MGKDEKYEAERDWEADGILEWKSPTWESLEGDGNRAPRIIKSARIESLLTLKDDLTERGFAKGFLFACDEWFEAASRCHRAGSVKETKQLLRTLKKLDRIIVDEARHLLACAGKRTQSVKVFRGPMIGLESKVREALKPELSEQEETVLAILTDIQRAYQSLASSFSHQAERTRSMRKADPLWVGDILIAMNGETINNPEDVFQRTGAITEGSTVKLTLMRQGKDMQVTLVAAKRPQ